MRGMALLLALAWSAAASCQEQIALPKMTSTVGEVFMDGSNFGIKDDDGARWNLALNDKSPSYKQNLKLLSESLGKQVKAIHRVGFIAIGDTKILLVDHVSPKGGK